MIADRPASGTHRRARGHPDRNARVARRQLPSGAWQVVQLPHQLSTNDSYNSISLGISPGDGRPHLGMDTHDNAV